MTDSPRWLEYMPVTDLPEDDRNPKHHAETELDASIDRWGYTEPVLRDERTGKLVAGHGRKAALLRAKAAGHHPPDGITADDSGEWLIPVVRGWASRSDAEAAGYLAAANQTTILGGWDDQALLDLLSEVSETDLGLSGIGFTDTDLEDMLAAFDDDQEGYETGPGPSGAAYAEDDDEAADRAERVSGQQSREAQGLAEVILVMTFDQKAAFAADLDLLREHYGDDEPTGSLVAQAVRAAVQILSDDG